MSDDIVDELRQFHHDEAADEIVRLRAEVEQLESAQFVITQNVWKE
jgi:hypothetical protein